jgi:Protein of unknown function (DUF2905)
MTDGATPFSIRPPTSRAGLACPAPMPELGRALIVLGVVITVIGLVLVFFERVPWVGRLPGDIYVQRGNWTFYFPLGTSILLSIVLTLVLWLIGRR